MKPLARREDLLAEPVGSELILYDPQGKKAHRLSPTAAFLWRKCDGVHTPAHLAKLLHEEIGLPQDEEIVVLALDQMQKQGLFKTTSIAGGLSRREAMRKFKALGIAAAMIPVVATIAAPPPAAAASSFSDPSPSSTRRHYSEDSWRWKEEQRSQEPWRSDDELRPGEAHIQKEETELSPGEVRIQKDEEDQDTLGTWH